jgi:hypothetical protein
MLPRGGQTGSRTAAAPEGDADWVMQRAQLFEFHDLEWFPVAVRDVLTDFMSWFATSFRVFRPIVPILRDAVRCAGADRIVDLCSGSGGPSLAICRELSKTAGDALPITLTDKFPNLEGFRRAAAASKSALTYLERPVDATAVPDELHGFRTLYTSFHHFAPPAARAILRDAVRKREGIGIFEYTERNFWIWGLPLLLTPLFAMLMMPFVRPFKASHLLWTYLLPVVPLVSAWDGVVSCLRTYSPSELLALAAESDGGKYEWRSGRVRAFGACRVTYLVGWPRGTSNE